MNDMIYLIIYLPDCVLNISDSGKKLSYEIQKGSSVIATVLISGISFIRNLLI